MGILVCMNDYYHQSILVELIQEKKIPWDNTHLCCHKQSTHMILKTQNTFHSHTCNNLMHPFDWYTNLVDKVNKQTYLACQNNIQVYKKCN